MTKNEAWNKGYDQAAKMDYESTQKSFIDSVISPLNLTKLSDDIRKAFIEGVKANWEDHIFNGAIWHEDECNGDYDCDCMK